VKTAFYELSRLIDNLCKHLKIQRKSFRRRFRLGLNYFRARFYRTRLNQTTFIGVTGSAAKTTTTDLTAAILSGTGLCRQTREYNALDSVIRLLLATGRLDRYCIAELAATGPGTLDLSVRVFKPDVAVITVIGRDHYSAYKSMEAIAAEKEKLVSALPPEGTAILNVDDPLVRAIGERCSRRVVWFGEDTGADLRLLETRSCWPEPLTLRVAVGSETYEVRTQLHGVHMVTPVLAALGVALAEGIPLDKAITALRHVQPPDGRMQAVAGDDGVVFVRDDWKAPAWSLDAPLRFLKDAKAARKVAVMGTLSHQSGKDAEKYKKFCLKAREIADLVVFVGPHAHHALRARKTKDDDSIQGFPNIRHAATFLKTVLKKGDLVLLKGSHKADHLVRLILNRSHPIQCWRDHCDKVLFCDACPMLYQSFEDNPFEIPMAPCSGPSVLVMVGLGNPVMSLRETAHNVGHRVLDALARDAGIPWKEAPEGLVSSMMLRGKTIRLLKPGMAMNSNGVMVRRFLERMGGDPQHCIIVHDDADLLLGEVRFKSEGGDAGHRGMSSVISALGTVEIPRVRLGIRRVGDKTKARRFVLSKFSSAEEAILSRMIGKASRTLKERLQSLLEDEVIEKEKRRDVELDGALKRRRMIDPSSGVLHCDRG